ncbi:hypothetical protein [Streptomyces sp. enrichment culture]
MDVQTHIVRDTQREAISHLDRLCKRRPARPGPPPLMPTAHVKGRT